MLFAMAPRSPLPSPCASHVKCKPGANARTRITQRQKLARVAVLGEAAARVEAVRESACAGKASWQKLPLRTESPCAWHVKCKPGANARTRITQRASVATARGLLCARGEEGAAEGSRARRGAMAGSTKGDMCPRGAPGWASDVEGVDERGRALPRRRVRRATGMPPPTAFVAPVVGALWAIWPHHHGAVILTSDC